MKGEHLTVFVRTEDGSVWIMDQEWTQEFWRDYAKTEDYILNPIDNLGKFSDFLGDELHDKDLEDWLYKNAKLSEPSALANVIFDVGDRIFPDCEPFEDEDESYNPYHAGRKHPDFVVKNIEEYTKGVNMPKRLSDLFEK